MPHRLRSFCLFTCVLACANSSAQDLLTNAVQIAMNDQWLHDSQKCLNALKIYGADKAQAPAALAALKAGQSQTVKSQYDAAAAIMGARFWKSLLTAHTMGSCATAKTQIDRQFGTDVAVLYAASVAHHTKNDFSAMQVLMSGNPTSPPTAADMEDYRACLANDDRYLFDHIDEVLGVQP
jgi:hypothetical protein